MTLTPGPEGFRIVTVKPNWAGRDAKPVFMSLARPRTVVCGRNMSGKTTLARQLAQLEGVECVGTVQHVPEELLLVGGWSDGATVNSILTQQVPQDQHVAAYQEVALQYQKILGERHELVVRPDGIDCQALAAGPLLCLHVATLVAARNLSRVHLPIILDEPYAFLGPDLRGRLARFLRQCAYQQIIFLSRLDVEQGSEDDAPHYSLDSSCAS